MFHLIANALMAICLIYLYIRCIRPLRVSLPLQACFLLLLCLALFKERIFRWIFSGTVTPEAPESVLLLGGWLHAAAILWTLCCLLLDGALLTGHMARRLPLFRRVPAPPRGPRLRVGLLLLTACLLATLGVHEAVRVPDVRRVRLAVPDLPPALEGLRIVQLSDLHVSPLFRQSWVREVVEKANALHPDVVALTGDMVDGETADRAADVKPLADLRARRGVFACMGNHEYYSGMKSWRRTLEGVGVRVLCNSHAVIPAGDAALVLGGVADPSGTGHPGMEGPDMTKTFAGSPPEGWRLLLAHRPALAESAAREGVKAQLSGHTHGGQLFPFSLLTARFNSGRLHGAYKVGDMILYVSRGAGLWAGFPIRLGAPAEITEIILHGAETRTQPAGVSLRTVRTATTPATAP